MDVEKEFIDLLVGHKEVIYKVCFMYARDKDDVNDLYQETVLNLWKAFPGFRKDSLPSTWIYRIALNTCISDLRKKKNMNYIPLEMNMDLYEECGHNELLDSLYQLIKRLNKLEKMFILLWLDEKSYEEIAEITGISRSNVAVRLHRIKDKLKKMSDLIIE